MRGYYPRGSQVRYTFLHYLQVHLPVSLTVSGIPPLYSCSCHNVELILMVSIESLALKISRFPRDVFENSPLICLCFRLRYLWCILPLGCLATLHHRSVLLLLKGAEARSLSKFKQRELPLN